VKRVALLDYAPGTCTRPHAPGPAGRQVEVTADRATALAADGLVVPGVGAFAGLHGGLRACAGTDHRPTARGGRPCSASASACRSVRTRRRVRRRSGRVRGWARHVARLTAPVLPHMGWNTVAARRTAPCSRDGRRHPVLLRALLRREPGNYPNPTSPPEKLTWPTRRPVPGRRENGPSQPPNSTRKNPATQCHPAAN